MYEVVNQPSPPRDRCRSSAEWRQHLVEYGFELYAGDWITIREACRSEAINELRRGQFSQSHLLFPPEFGAGDILFLQ
ncbi:hypothetical protein, partial [Stieleria mannarensis]|uniref:hypothetical protein n=1 Tax=Stieleria mannarensis TaxID=2755585 RepID=UPI001C721CB0